MFHLIDLGSFCFFVYTNLFARLLLRFSYISVLKESPEYGQLLGQEKLLFAQQPKVEKLSLYPPKTETRPLSGFRFRNWLFRLFHADLAVSFGLVLCLDQFFTHVFVPFCDL